MTDRTNRTWTGHVFVGASLDGLIARLDGDLDWLTDPAPGAHAAVTSSRTAPGYETFYADTDHLVWGRGTYDKILTFGQWPHEGMPVIVLSTTLDVEDDRITVARSLEAVLDLLERARARRVYVDGGQVIQTFLQADLIDEIHLAWAPVLIGSGLPLFGDLDRDVRLCLTASHAGDNGFVHASYRVHRD